MQYREPDDRIEKRIDNTPEKLEDLFNQMLERIGPHMRKEIRLLLSLVADALWALHLGRLWVDKIENDPDFLYLLPIKTWGEEKRREYLQVVKLQLQRALGSRPRAEDAES